MLGDLFIAGWDESDISRNACQPNRQVVHWQRERAVSAGIRPGEDKWGDSWEYFEGLIPRMWRSSSAASR
jgi:hypothetical protein